jgi:hypothetical protein
VVAEIAAKKAMEEAARIAAEEAAKKAAADWAEADRLAEIAKNEAEAAKKALAEKEAKDAQEAADKSAKEAEDKQKAYNESTQKAGTAQQAYTDVLSIEIEATNGVVVSIPVDKLETIRGQLTGGTPHPEYGVGIPQPDGPGPVLYDSAGNPYWLTKAEHAALMGLVETASPVQQSAPARPPGHGPAKDCGRRRMRTALFWRR